jgi:hypothetical protein
MSYVLIDNKSFLFRVKFPADRAGKSPPDARHDLKTMMAMNLDIFCIMSDKRNYT